ILAATTPGVVAIPTGAIVVGDFIGGDGLDVLKFANGSAAAQIGSAVAIIINNSGKFDVNSIGTSGTPVTIGALTMVGGTANVGSGYLAVSTGGAVSSQFVSISLNDPYNAQGVNVAVITGTGTISLPASAVIDVQSGLASVTDAATGLADLADLVVQPTIAGVATSLTKQNAGILRLAVTSTS